MSMRPPATTACPAISPVYPFNEPGEPIVLYDGPVGELGPHDVPGVVELSCTPDLGVVWRIEDDPKVGVPSDSVTLLLRRPNGDARLSGTWRGVVDGWSNGAVIGNTDARLQRIVAHWFNLPDLLGPIALSSRGEDGEVEWLGRSQIHVGGWTLILDVRPDHARVWKHLHKARVYVMTHVIEIRRADGAAFTTAEAEPLLTALHVGVSFALGRWAAPMLPVGLDGAGNVVWEEWRAYHCDPARAISSGWWYERQHASLADFLRLAIPAFSDPNRLPALRLQMMCGIAAMNDRGFVEQRVMMAAAGLEHVMWQTLVRDGGMGEDEYRDRPAHELLRYVLAKAQIPTDIDAELLPVMARFVTEERTRQGRALDGPEVVTQIRNRLVHPKGAQDLVYRMEGLIVEVWLLVSHYLVLLILHSLGYQGAYRDLRKTHGWAGEVGSVPWA
jgi:hypothetical protein